MDMIHPEVLEETLNKNFKRWSRSDAFMEAMIDRIVKNPGYIAPVAASFKQRATNTI